MWVLMGCALLLRIWQRRCRKGGREGTSAAVWGAVLGLLRGAGRGARSPLCNLHCSPGGRAAAPITLTCMSLYPAARAARLVAVLQHPSLPCVSVARQPPFATHLSFHAPHSCPYSLPTEAPRTKPGAHRVDA